MTRVFGGTTPWPRQLVMIRRRQLLASYSMLYDALMIAFADDVMPSSVESPMALIGGRVAAAAGVAVVVTSAGSPTPSTASTAAQRAKQDPPHEANVAVPPRARTVAPCWSAAEQSGRAASQRRYTRSRNVNGADRFRRQSRWPSVRPELLRLAKRGTNNNCRYQRAVRSRRLVPR